MAQHGLHFRKIDLHTHTPASRCYKYPDHTPTDFVQAAIAAGLDAIAVTDHNSADWIDRIKAAAQGTSLAVFPGVEISAQGYHVVALFDITASQRDVELFLGAIGITAQGYGHSEVICEESVYKIFNIIHDRNGLAILAHIDSIKGAFFELTSRDPDTKRLVVGNDCASLFSNPNYDAVEVTASHLPDGFDAAHQVKRIPAFYKSSDNPSPIDPVQHSIEGIGKRYSWFHLDEITLEGLRQCFADPEVRIRQMGEWKELLSPHITKMSIGPSGFLAYQNFNFHPGLNSIIGGKGAGKSLAIEFLRFGLRQPSLNPEIHRDFEGKLEKRLGSLNTITIELQLPSGVTYTLKQTYRSNEESSFECINTQTGEKYTGDLGSLFPVLAYSQTEVIKIAESEDAQLRLVDSLIDPRPFKREIDGIQDQLNQNNRSIVQALEAREKAKQCRIDIGTFQEQIGNIDRQLASPLLTQMKLAETKKDAFENQAAFLKQLRNLVQGHQTKVEELALPDLPQGLESDQVLLAQLKQLADVRQQILDMNTDLSAKAQGVQQSLLAAQTNWMPEFESIKQQYEVQLSGTDKAQLEAKRRYLESEKGRLEQQWEGHRKLADEDLPKLLEQRKQLLDNLDAQYQTYYTARKKKFDDLTNLSDGKLKLELDHASNRERYQEALVDLLKGSGTSTIAVAQRNQVAQNVSPRELGNVIMARDIDEFATASALSKEMAERAMDKLWNSDNFSEVLAIQHAYYPEDTPTIKFNKGNGQFAELKDLSVGQKCTALLIIALCDGEMPVIIDQPEDALDIASVWEDIAKKLRRGKYSRQFILTTHNSSLAVGSDSDNFIVLTPSGADRAKVSHKGAIDRKDVRQQVIAHLEGGDEPYKLRQRKYDIR